MLPDAELISLLCTILTRLEVGDFTVKVSHPSYEKNRGAQELL